MVRHWDKRGINLRDLLDAYREGAISEDELLIVLEAVVILGHKVYPKCEVLP